MRDRRVLVFVLLVVACAAVGGTAVLASVRSSDRADAEAEAGGDALSRAAADRAPVVVYRGGGRDEGRIALARLGREQAPPTTLPLRCDRVYFAAGTGLCLARGTSFAAGYQAKVFGTDLRVAHAVDIEGIPSRARVSRDGRYGSVTMFVTGHSYADAGQFSTQTTLIDLRAGRKVADLEEFVVTKAGRRVTAIDVNFWGVTFEDDSDRFYATMATGGKTYLIHGSIRQRVARVLHENVECPSLSPDGTRIAYKRRTGSATTPWRITVLDLATMRETPLAETRSVDDQVEWLDDAHVVYGVDGGVFQVAADGTGEPRPYLRGASSPAVVRW